MTDLKQTKIIVSETTIDKVVADIRPSMTDAVINTIITNPVITDNIRVSYLQFATEPKGNFFQLHVEIDGTTLSRNTGQLRVDEYINNPTALGNKVKEIVHLMGIETVAPAAQPVTVPNSQSVEPLVVAQGIDLSAPTSEVVEAEPTLVQPQVVPTSSFTVTKASLIPTRHGVEAVVTSQETHTLPSQEVEPVHSEHSATLSTTETLSTAVISAPEFTGLKARALERMNGWMATEHSAEEDRIHVWLSQRSDEDAELWQGIMIDDGRDMKGAMAYIKGLAHKQAKNGMAMVDDDTVFGWARAYFMQPKAEKPVAKETAPKAKPAAKKATRKAKATPKPAVQEVDLFDGLDLF